MNNIQFPFIIHLHLDFQALFNSSRNQPIFVSAARKLLIIFPPPKYLG